MSNLTPIGTIKKVIEEAIAGTFSFEGERIGSAGYIRGLMNDVITGAVEPTTNCLGMRGWVIAQTPIAIIDATSRITTPVDTTITVPANKVYLSTDDIAVDSVAAGDGIVEVSGVWKIYESTDNVITTPVDESIKVAPSDTATSVGAIEVDSVAAGFGNVSVYGLWTFNLGV